jgi:hypothetical protein
MNESASIWARDLAVVFAPIPGSIITGTDPTRTKANASAKNSMPGETNNMERDPRQIPIF